MFFYFIICLIICHSGDFAKACFHYLPHRFLRQLALMCYVAKAFHRIAEQSVVILQRFLIVRRDYAYEVHDVMFNLLAYTVGLFPEPYEEVVKFF